MSLIKNYVKVSWRDLLRHKTYTTINLMGLVSAMTISLMILQYVVYETGFDRLHTDHDRIFRVVNDRYQKGELVQHGTITYPIIGPTLAKDLPEIEAYTRMTFNTREYIGYNDDLYLTQQFLIADEHFLPFFSFELLHGNDKTALEAPFQAILTESFARRLLNSDDDPVDMLGQSIEIYGRPAKVTGILKDVPSQSHLQFDMLLSYNTFIDLAGESADNSWQWSDFYHYVKLKEASSIESLRPKLAEFGERYFKDGEVSGSEEEFYLQPLAAAHLDPTMEYEIGSVVDGQIVWTMLVIAGFILLIAWINYINLTTSRALQRAKEVGIRKLIGADRSHVISQFVVETLIINGLALFASIGLVWLLQPFVNLLTNLNLSLGTLWFSQLFGVPFVLLFSIAFILGLIVISLYPAMVLARFKAKDVIYGRCKLMGGVAWLRKALVVFQFVTAIALINGAMAISEQVDFMLNKEIGLNIDNTLVVYGPSRTDWDSTYITKVDRFRNEVQRQPGVEMVSTSNRIAGEIMGRIFQVRSNGNPETKDLTLNFLSVDYNFEQLYGLKMLEGRFFESMDYNYDPNFIHNIIVNETSIAYLGFTSLSDALGASISFNNRDWTIIGVVKDFHQRTLHEKIEPIALLPYLGTEHSYAIKLGSEPNEAVLTNINNIYDEVFPGNYFDYFFLEDQYAGLYRPELRLSYVSKVFTVLAIIMVILGLYGLTTMTLEKRVKEIGIRKVLGARLGQLLLHLTRDFAVLMLIALLLGVPFSLYVIDLWKADFAYTAQLGIGSVALACSLVIVFSSIPILFQARRAASNNPIEALRSE
ncbi:MAG: FtsX-like permease family protein [Cyclobacteriaceae bacterium]